MQKVKNSIEKFAHNVERYLCGFKDEHRTSHHKIGKNYYFEGAQLNIENKLSIMKINVGNSIKC